MHKYFLFAFFTLASFPSFAQQQEPWCNPFIFSVNKEKYHVPIVPFEELDEALEGDIKKSPDYMSINGLWKFKWFPSHKDTIPGFYKTGFDAQHWNDVSIPGFIGMQGQALSKYEKYDPTSMSNPVGIYRTTMMLSEAWEGKEVFINFDGVSAAFFLWVNGQQVGYSENSYSPAEFNITKYLKKGANILVTEVFKYSDGNYLEDPGKDMIHGVFRDVYLYATPKLQIRDYKVETDFDENYTNATIRIKGEVRNLDKKDLYKYSIEFALYDTKNKIVFSEKSPLFSFAKTKSKTKGIAYEKLINTPQKWNSENPYLYTLVITMRSDKDKILEILSNKVGFKEVEKKNGVVYLNDKRLIVKGIIADEPKHETSEGALKQEIFSLKQNNINAVYSNYPFSPAWYNLCDKYGIYIFNQADLYIGNNTDVFSKDTALSAVLMDRCYSLIERDKNHSSVLAWSVGNIKNDDYQIKMSSYIYSYDKKRITINKAIDSQSLTDIILISDTSVQSISAKLKKEKKPTIGIYDIKEINIDSLFALTNVYPHFQGLFYSTGLPLNSSADKQVKVKTVFQPIVIRFSDTLFNKIYIKNLHEVKNLNTYNVSWELKDDKNNVQSGLLKPDVPAGEEKEMLIPYKKTLSEGKYELSVHFKLSGSYEWANKGFEVSDCHLLFSRGDFKKKY